MRWKDPVWRLLVSCCLLRPDMSVVCTPQRVWNVSQWALRRSGPSAYRLVGTMNPKSHKELVSVINSLKINKRCSGVQGVVVPVLRGRCLVVYVWCCPCLLCCSVSFGVVKVVARLSGACLLSTSGECTWFGPCDWLRNDSMAINVLVCILSYDRPRMDSMVFTVPVSWSISRLLLQVVM